MAATVDNYTKGYSDGYHGVSPNASLVGDPDYYSGFVDGQGDRERGAEVPGVKSAFTDKDFYKNNDPPEGYRWAQDYRTPQKGEIYYTKNGNAGVAKTDPKNNRKRHLLVAETPCGASRNWRTDDTCKFARWHTGRCSTLQVK